MTTEGHYCQEFIIKCTPFFIQGFNSIYKTTLKKCSKRKYLLKEFQEALESIPLWNSKIIDNEYARFKNASNCEWLENLIKAAFVELSERLTKGTKNIDNDIPKGEFFIHTCYINIAREMWRQPQLFYHGLSTLEKKQNEDDIKSIIHKVISDTIRNSLPLEDIVDNYLNNDITQNVNQDSNENEGLVEIGTKNVTGGHNKNTEDTIKLLIKNKNVTGGHNKNTEDTIQRSETQNMNKENMNTNQHKDISIVETLRENNLVHNKDVLEKDIISVNKRTDNVRQKEEFERSIDNIDHEDDVENKDKVENVENVENDEDDEDDEDVENVEDDENDEDVEDVVDVVDENFEDVDENFVGGTFDVKEENTENDEDVDVDVDVIEESSDVKENTGVIKQTSDVIEQTSDVEENTGVIEETVGGTGTSDVVEEIDCLTEDDDCNVIIPSDDSSDEDKEYVKERYDTRERNIEKIRNILGSNANYTDFRSKKNIRRLRRSLLLKKQYI